MELVRDYHLFPQLSEDLDRVWHIQQITEHISKIPSTFLRDCTLDWKFSIEMVCRSWIAFWLHTDIFIGSFWRLKIGPHLILKQRSRGCLMLNTYTSAAGTSSFEHVLSGITGCAQTLLNYWHTLGWIESRFSKDRSPVITFQPPVATTPYALRCWIFVLITQVTYGCKQLVLISLLKYCISA